MKLHFAFAPFILCAGSCAGSTGAPPSPAQSPSKPAASASNAGAVTASGAPSANDTVAPSAPSRAAPAIVGDAEMNGNEPLSVSVAKAHADGKHYALDAKAPASVKVGATGEIEFTLAAKDGYHTNDKYPYKLTPTADPPALVTFDKKELLRGEGTFSKTDAKFRVKFGAARSGSVKVGGLLAFSVCTAKECVVDKIELTVPVTIR